LADSLQNIPSSRAIPELLSQPQIFFLSYLSEFSGMFTIMVLKFLGRGEPDLRASDER